MSKYTKVRRIQKGQLGLEFGVTNIGNSTLTQTAQDAVNNQINQSTQGIRNQIYLRQFANQLLNGYQLASPYIYEGLTNFGIMSGNSTMANLGQLGGSINNGIQLAQNWKGLSSADKTTGVAGIAGQAADTLDNMFFSKQHANDSALTKGLNNAYDSVSSAAMMFSPVGTILGGAMKAGKLLGDGLTALGVGTDQMTTTDQVLDSSFMKLTPVGLINGIGGKRTQDFSANNDTIEKVGSSYGGSVNLINEAVSKAGKKYGLFSGGARRRANRLINTARNQQNTMTGISNEYQDQLANKSDLAYTRYNMDINGGYPQQYIRAAKYGAILNRIQLRKHKEGGTLSNQLHSKINLETQEVEWKPVININQETPEFKDGGELVNNQETIQEINSKWQPTINLEAIQTMAEGGKTKESEKPKQETNQKNVIPEGALHAHKHNMEHAEDLTKKGIPVVDNKGEQQAEVEKNEIIFSLEVTKQLEELHKKYQSEESTQKEKDEVAVEAGKLLVYEILHNTIDRTGLIKECKKGGILNGNQ